MSQPVFIGLDAGTTGVKATAFTSEAAAVCSARADLPMLSPVPGAAEQDPEVYVATCLQVLAECVDLARHHHGCEIAAVGLSAIIGSLVALDADRCPLGLALTWADLRCGPQVRASQKALDHDRVYQRTGCQIHSIYTGPKIGWLAEHYPERFGLARWFVPLKTYLLYHFTGHLLLDRSVGSGSGMLDTAGLSWNDEWLSYLGVRPDQLGELVESHEQVRFRPAIAAQVGLPERTPLIVGAADGMLSSVGVGGIGTGVYTAMIATSAACRTIDARPVLHPGRATWSYYLADGLWVNGGAISSAGIVYRWVRDTFFADRSDRDDYTPVNAAAQAAPIGAEGLLLLPYLAGERSPNWNVDARGMLLGLTLGHSRDHIARAAMESICLHLGQVFTALKEVCAQPSEVRTTGGFTGSRFWVQMLADCLGTPLSLPAKGDASVLGAALLAMRSMHVIDSLEQAADMIPIVERVDPDPAASAHYAAQMLKFDVMYEALLDHFSHFAA